MTLGSNPIFKYTLYNFHTLQVYCMIVLVYGCGNELVMRYQMFVVCFFTDVQCKLYILHAKLQIPSNTLKFF